MGIHHLYGFFAADAEEILRNIYGGSLYYPVIVFEQQIINKTYRACGGILDRENAHGVAVMTYFFKNILKTGLELRGIYAEHPARRGVREGTLGALTYHAVIIH